MPRFIHPRHKLRSPPLAASRRSIPGPMHGVAIAAKQPEIPVNAKKIIFPVIGPITGNFPAGTGNSQRSFFPGAPPPRIPVPRHPGRTMAGRMMQRPVLLITGMLAPGAAGCGAVHPSPDGLRAPCRLGLTVGSMRRLIAHADSGCISVSDAGPTRWWELQGAMPTKERLCHR